MIRELLENPSPFRNIAYRRFEKLLYSLTGYPTDHYLKLVKKGWVERHGYAVMILRGFTTARSLGIKKVSFIEFGVASGNGLCNIEEHCEKLGPYFDIGYEIYGFDTGKGLPMSEDYRDAPYQWAEGDYAMDVDKLKAKLKVSELVLGNVADTIATFFETYDPAPIAAIMFDLDYYSSTMAALSILEGNAEFLLPRVPCYFDDLYFEYNGVALAISDFNQKYPSRKMGKIYINGSSYSDHRHKFFEFHDFLHPSYNLNSRRRAASK